MRTVNIIKTYRDKQNRIFKYTMIDNFGITEEITPKELKEQIKLGKITVNNFKLTSNNRLIQTKETKKLSLKEKINTNNQKYFLMNKDNIVATIDIGFNTYKINGKLPYNYNNAIDWINLRAKFSCARNVKEFFETIGIKSTNDFINITHCVSLHDTFWIKDINSKILWKNVSPFRNDYSKVISTYALDGKLIKGDKNYFSPVVSTNGTFPHTWKFNQGNIKFIKASSKYTLGGSNSGREPYSEYYASVIAKYLNFSHIDYNIRYHKRVDNRIDVVTECDCYTSEEIGAITAHNLRLKSYEKVISYCKQLGNESLQTILDMLFLDCLLLNTDRHFSNIEFFINNDTLQVLKIVPIFDNNLSLLPRFIEDYDTFNREEYIARDDRSFEDLYRLIRRYRNYTKELIGLKSLRLTEPEKVDISSKRLEFLNKFLQMQVSYLLSLK